MNTFKGDPLQEKIPLKSNIPIDFSKEKEDLFNTLPKADTIKDFIINYPFEKNKMLALYGEWGSGKTTLLCYIQKELVNKNFKPIFFEAWKLEKDGNLAISLLDIICNEAGEKSQDKIDIIKKTASRVFKNFMKGIQVNLPFFPVGVDFGKIIDSAENEDKENTSYYKKIKEFENQFIEIENKILNKDNQKLIVFIDDLDRCEPENVLNLLSAIKLFFTLGKNTIYFCGIDKEAVEKAVKIKYKDVIKSEEYLEKIFDISFNMPKNFIIEKLLKYYFPKSKINNEIYNTFIKTLADFFKSIEFTNPRHLKKVLNKYLIVEYIKNSHLANHELIPDILYNLYNIINNILVLYFIILYEFYPEKFYEIEDIETKSNAYSQKFYEYYKQYTSNFKISSALVEVKRYFNKDLVKKELLNDYLYRIKNEETKENKYEMIKFISNFTPNPLDLIIPDEKNVLNYILSFEDKKNKILTNFCKYLINNKNLIYNSRHTSDYKFWNLFEMAKTIL